jgi:hypothetical protein
MYNRYKRGFKRDNVTLVINYVIKDWDISANVGVEV